MLILQTWDLAIWWWWHFVLCLSRWSKCFLGCFFSIVLVSRLLYIAVYFVYNIGFPLSPPEYYCALQSVDSQGIFVIWEPLTSKVYKWRLVLYADIKQTITRCLHLPQQHDIIFPSGSTGRFASCDTAAWVPHIA